MFVTTFVVTVVHIGLIIIILHCSVPCEEKANPLDPVMESKEPEQLQDDPNQTQFLQDLKLTALRSRTDPKPSIFNATCKLSINYLIFCTALFVFILNS